MKILAIHIKNLASLEGEHTIDFCSEPLQSAGIFAITGPTGAGKSTLLDALCLALYEEAPRYKNAAKGNTVTDTTGSVMQQNDPRKILRDGSGEGYAKVDFVGIDGIPYQAGWTIRRARGKASGRLQKAEMQLTNLRTGQVLPGKKMEILAEIEKCVGLNFEQFTRSVLLAQGDFTAFLKAGKDEQSSLLEKLTGMQVYSEISKQIFERWREEEQRLREWKVREEGVALLSESALVELRHQFVNATAQLKTGKQALKEIEEKLSWRRQLEQLKEQSLQSHKDFLAATEEHNSMADRVRSLMLVKAIQPARPILRRFQEQVQQLIEKQNSLQKLEDDFRLLESERENILASLRKVKQHLLQVEKEYEAALPDLVLARELDTRLQDKMEHLANLEAQLQQGKDSVRSLKQQLETAQKQFQQLEQKKEDLLSWQKKNEGRRAIAEQEKLILTKLKDASEDLQQIAANKQATVEEQAIDADLKQKIEAIDGKHAEWRKEYYQQKEHFRALQEELRATDFRYIAEAENKVEANVSEWNLALARWKIMFHEIQETRKLERQIIDASELLKTKENRLGLHNERLPHLKAQKESAAELLQKAQQAVANNVETLRDSLNEGEACPVCGSKSHPYKQENTQLHLVFSELKKAFDNYEAEYRRYEMETRHLEQDCRILNLDREKWQKELQDWQTKLQSGEKEWQAFSFYESCEAVPEEKRLVWLETALAEENTKLNGLRQKMREHNQLKEKSENLSIWLSEQETIGHQLENKRKDYLRKIEGVKENKLRLFKERERLELDLQQQKEELSKFLTTEGWFVAWKENPSAFIEKIVLFANKWQSQVQQYETVGTQINQAALTFHSLKEKYDTLKSQWENQEENLNNVRKQEQALLKERFQLFEGQKVQERETLLKSRIQKAKQELEVKNAEKEKVVAQFTRMETLLSQTKEGIKLLAQNQQSAHLALDNWLEGFHNTNSNSITLEKLKKLLDYDDEWIEREQNAIQAIKNSVLQAESIWKERQGAVEKLQSENKSVQSLDALLRLNAEANTQLEEYNKAFHEIDYRLKEDAANKKRMAEILAATEKQARIVERWAKLNEVVGSADGKKFRQIAQEYTLEVLLSFANVHLKNLNPRYVLQKIPDGLGLQVMDLDMGREVRTVFSLSGGESFLVSLALALGLASLSSNRMKVESLFIDEGFGSLDADTLNIAMDALERLYNQGRKVGVISHVQEMTERIPVQIKVQKRQSGKSKLAITSF